MDPHISVASVGECMVELSADGDGLWRQGFAGDTFNTLWTMRAVLPENATCDFVSAFGDDPFSRAQQSFFAEAGIGTADSPVIAGARPGLYAITLENAERSFTYWRNDAAARRLADDTASLDRSLAGRRLIHFSGITLAILSDDARARFLAAIDAARRAGALVSFDPNYRTRLWTSVDDARETLLRGADRADILLPGRDDEQALHGDETADQCLARLGSGRSVEIVLKDGASAAHVLHQGAVNRIPSVAVRAVDTTGAGDGFDGAYLAARLLGRAPDDAAAAAHRVAAAIVTKKGALIAPPDIRKAFEAGSA